MNIDKIILFKKIQQVLEKNNSKINCDFSWLMWLIKLIIFHNPIENVIFKSSQKDWTNLPKDKSLFYSKTNVGLPIGNLTPQLFGNVYLHSLDVYIKYQLNFKYYGRYVDDFL